MTDEQLARWVALALLAVFLIFAAIAYLDPSRPIPDPLYPVALAAAGYLFGWRVHRGGKDDPPDGG